MHTRRCSQPLSRCICDFVCRSCCISLYALRFFSSASPLIFPKADVVDDSRVPSTFALGTFRSRSPPRNRSATSPAILFNFPLQPAVLSFFTCPTSATSTLRAVLPSCFPLHRRQRRSPSSRSSHFNPPWHPVWISTKPRHHDIKTDLGSEAAARRSNFKSTSRRLKELAQMACRQ